MVGLLLLAKTDLNGILDVTTDIDQHLNPSVHFALEETEQRVANVLDSTLHGCH